MSTDTCVSCHDPLLIEVEADSDSEDNAGSSSAPQSVPDDVELGCGCHYHWECFLEAYTVTECPNCSKDISSLSPTGQQVVLCTVRNEGGIQQDYDILPSASEEQYLTAYPEERIGHAFLEFVRQGDLDAVLHLIKDTELDDADDHAEQIDILRYQGTFEGIEGSGLHVAVRYNQPQIAWLLLVLGSSYPWDKFPASVLGAMEGFNLSKEDRRAGTDIRSLKDSEGRTAADVAKEVGGWAEWIQSGRLLPG